MIHHRFNQYLLNSLMSLLLVVPIANSAQAVEAFDLHQLIPLDNPWGMQWLDDRQLLITEKDGRLGLYNRLTNTLRSIQHNLNVAEVGQGGLLDVSHSNGDLFVCYSRNQKEGYYGNKYTTAIAKASYQSNQPLDFKTIFSAHYPVNSGYHFGCRLLIHQQALYATIGERGQGGVAQQADNHIGSIVRLNLDGTPHQDNPHFSNQPSWLAEIYQLGVRNPQGLAYHPLSRQIFISNHGARGGDFVGPVIKGGNYGWNTIGWGGVNYIGTDIGEGIAWRKPFTKPAITWVPSIAVSQIESYQADAFASLKGSLLLSSLKNRSLRQLVIDEQAQVIEQNILFENRIGRIRDVSVNPSTGNIYLLSNARGGLWRMSPG